MAVAIVRHAGARNVVITDINPYRLDLAKKMATNVFAVDVRTISLGDAMKQLGMKEGFDVGLEMSGNPAAFRDMLANMAHGGKIAMLGIPSEEIAIDWNKVVFDMLTIKGPPVTRLVFWPEAAVTNPLEDSRPAAAPNASNPVASEKTRSRPATSPLASCSRPLRR